MNLTKLERNEQCVLCLAFRLNMSSPFRKALLAKLLEDSVPNHDLSDA